MKYISTTFLLIILISVSIYSQTFPQIVNFQGVLKDENGNFYPDGQYEIKINIYNSETGGSSLWDETQNVNLEDGIFSIQIGDVNPLNLDFDELYWVAISIDGGSELSPRLQLRISPLQFYEYECYEWNHNRSENC
jgi:hypothetical protein